MRCLALAQAWSDSGGHVTFAVGELPPPLEQRLQREGIGVVRLADSSAVRLRTLAGDLEAGWVVVDGYHFSATLPETLRAAGLRILQIDDGGDAGPYAADLVLNQNLHASETLYPQRSAHTRLLLGTHFAMLRREFTSWRNWSRELPSRNQRLLVTMGGSDPENVTTQVLHALSSFPPATGVVVVGAANPNARQVREIVQQMPGWEVLENASNMPELMSQADLAIAASGSTSWELAFMGLPSILLALAENQRPLAEGLAVRGVGLAIGSVDELPRALETLLSDAATRAAMSRRGRELIDGCGAERVVRTMKEWVA